MPSAVDYSKVLLYPYHKEYTNKLMRKVEFSVYDGYDVKDKKFRRHFPHRLCFEAVYTPADIGAALPQLAYCYT